MATHRGHIIVDAIGTGVDGDPQRPDITFTVDGDKWEDITGTPAAQYINPPPNSLVVYAETSEANFLSYGADTLWYEEIPAEVI